MFKDILYLVTDFCELPRRGVADYQGEPHYFISLFDDDSNDWSDIYILYKIDERSFDLTLLAWAIERRFCVYKADEDISFNRIGALPEEKNRHSSIINLIESKINVNPSAVKYAYGQFQLLEPKMNFNLAFINWVLLPKTNDLQVYYEKSTWRFRKNRYSHKVFTEGDYF